MRFHDSLQSLQLGLTALHIAAWKGHTAVVEMLLHEGCSPMALSQNSKTALQLAVEENQHECVTILTAASSKVTVTITMLMTWILVLEDLGPQAGVDPGFSGGGGGGGANGNAWPQGGGCEREHRTFAMCA